MFRHFYTRKFLFVWTQSRKNYTVFSVILQLSCESNTLQNWDLLAEQYEMIQFRKGIVN